MALTNRDRDSGRFPGSVVEGDLLTSITAVTDGAWNRLDSEPFSVTVETSGWTGTVQLRVSNSVTEPSSGELGSPLGDDMTASTTVSFDMPFNWIRARVTAYSAGTLTRVSVRARRWKS